MKKDLRKKIFVLTLLTQTTLSCACVGFNGDDERLEGSPLTVHSIPVAIDPILQIRDEQEKQKNEAIYFGVDKVDPSMEGLPDAIVKKLWSKGVSKNSIKQVSKTLSKATIEILETKTAALTEAQIELLVAGMRNGSGNITKKLVNNATNNIDTILKNGLPQVTKNSLKFRKVTENGLKDTGETLVKETKGAFNQMGNAAKKAAVTLVDETGQTVIVAAQTAGSTARNLIKNGAAAVAGGGGTALYLKSKPVEKENNDKKSDLNSKTLEQLEEMKEKLKEKEALYNVVKKELEKTVVPPVEKPSTPKV